MDPRELIASLLEGLGNLPARLFGSAPASRASRPRRLSASLGGLVTDPGRPRRRQRRVSQPAPKRVRRVAPKSSPSVCKT